MSLHHYETQRLKLSPTSEEDGEFVWELMNTPKFIRYIGDRQLKDVTSAQRYIRENLLPQIQELGFGSYTIIRRSDHLKIGICTLFDRPGLEGIDLGFALLPSFEKMGYAFEAAQRIILAAFDDFNLNELIAVTSTDNSASQSLLLRLGFTFRGVEKWMGTEEDVYIYELNSGTNENINL